MLQGYVRKTEYATAFLVCCLLVSIISLAAIRQTQKVLSSSGGISILSPLHTDGKYIKKDSGDIVFLRGVNKDGFSYDYTGWWNPIGGDRGSGYGHWNPDAVKANLDAMKSWGMNVARLQMAMDWWLSDNSTINYKENLKNVAAMAEKSGLYIVLALSAALHGNHEPLPFPPYDDGHNIVPDANGFVNFWVSVAEEFKGHHNVLFELYNEPHVPRGGSYSDTMSAWIEAVQQTVDSIRQVSDAIIIVQWNWDVDLGWVSKNLVNGTNIVYSGHLYRYLGHLGPAKPYKYEDIKQGLIDRGWLDVTELLKKPVILGEIGASLPNDLEGYESEFLKNTLQIMNEWGLSYIVWHWFTTARTLGLLEDTLFIPNPNYVGETLISSISSGKAYPQQYISMPLVLGNKHANYPNRAGSKTTIIGSRFYFSGSGIVESISVYLWLFSSAGVTISIYDDVNGSPANMIINGTNPSAPSGEGWKVIYVDPKQLGPGYYWLVFKTEIGDWDNVRFYGENGGRGIMASQDYWENWSPIWSNGIYNDIRISIYATLNWFSEETISNYNAQLKTTSKPHVIYANNLISSLSFDDDSKVLRLTMAGNGRGTVKVYTSNFGEPVRISNATEIFYDPIVKVVDLSVELGGDILIDWRP